MLYQHENSSATHIAVKLSHAKDVLLLPTSSIPKMLLLPSYLIVSGAASELRETSARAHGRVQSLRAAG